MSFLCQDHFPVKSSLCHKSKVQLSNYFEPEINHHQRASMEDKKLHIAMYPWFAMGHITPFLHISNKLAERGHSISFLLPKNTQPKIEHLNHHKDLITFIPITVPCVDGLPPGTETTNDVPRPLVHLLMKAMDLTEPIIGAILCNIKPHIVFFDFTHWLPPLARKLGIKCIDFVIVSPAIIGYGLRSETETESEWLQPPKGFPSSKIKVSAFEARELAPPPGKVNDSSGIPFMERLRVSLSECDAVGFRTCREIEGAYCDYVESRLEKRVILAGPVLPEPPNSVLEEEIETWFSKFEAKSMIFCALGSESTLKEEQFQELVLGFELTGLPFLAVLKPPMGHDTIESALPQGFKERVKGRGLVHQGWIQQLLILKHPSVGCFVTHCGSGSLSEALVNDCQLVLLPTYLDHSVNARLMGEDLKVGVEVERGYEDGLFTRDGVCKAVKAVMDDDSEVGKEVRQNHAKFRQILTSPGFENAYVDGFVQELHRLVELK